MFGSTRDHFDKRKMIGFKIFAGYAEDVLMAKIEEFLGNGWIVFNSGCDHFDTFNTHHWVHLVLYEENYK